MSSNTLNIINKKLKNQSEEFWKTKQKTIGKNII